MHIQDKFNNIKELHKNDGGHGWHNPGNNFLLVLEKNGKFGMDKDLYSRTTI